MTSLTPSPLMVALMQTATSLPVFLVGLPAGALADIVDRRRLLLLWQGWMLVTSLALGVLTFLNVTTPWVLLALTFSMGLGSAMNAPAWQAIIPELVPRSDLPPAVTLNSVGFNLARAVGPALGGIVVAAAGPEAVFLLNAVSFVGVMFVLYKWKRSPRKNALPTERMIGAIRAGMRYVQYSPALRVVLIRAGVFISCGSALWALLPLVARQQLKLGSFGYGVLLGCLGLGAVMGAFLLPKVRRRISTDLLIVIATILFAIATLALAYLRNLGLIYIALIVGGVAWIALMSSLNVAVQSLHWPEPNVVIELRPDEGPVLITVEYRIDPDRSREFAKAMHDLSISRRRDGAIRWGLFEDTADPSRYLETFVVESWAEHLRQHERVTAADRTDQERASAFHIGDTPPIIAHLIYAHDVEGDR
jgi:MFS family permease/quinol monooxygenase YgiN